MDRENMQVGRFDDWLRWLIGGAVAGLIAYASVGARLATLETTVTMGQRQSMEDRADFRKSLEDMQHQLIQLTIELRQEEQKRRDGVGTGDAGRRFDK